jgi:hypothetical protein
MPTKLYSRLTDVRGLPAAEKFNTMRANIPPIGRLLNLKCSVTQNGAPAPLDVMRAAIGDVSLVLGSETVRKVRFAEYLAMLELNGYVLSPGYFPYFLAEPWRATVRDEELTSLQLGGVYANASLDCDVTQPADALDFDFAYEYDMAPKVVNAQMVRGIFGHTVQVEDPGGGEPIIGIKSDTFAGPLQRLHVVVPAAVNVTRVRVLQGDSSIFDRLNTAAKPEIARQLQDMGLVIPAPFATQWGQFKLLPVVFDNNQRLENSIVAKANLKLQLNLSASAQVRLIYEHVIER